VTEPAIQNAPPATIRLGPAFGTWAIAWSSGMVVLAPVVIVALGGEVGDDLSIPVLAAATGVAWAIFVAALVFTSRRFGSAAPIADYAVRFRPVDLVGIPLGVVTQLALVPLLYVPLQEWWPGTFSDERLEERANDLVDRAGGAMTVLLILVVVVGAPLFEELVYRGLLQRSLMSAIGPAAGLVVASLWFAFVHPSPVEYPGLALAGLVFGAGVFVTGRLGASIITHAAFNATGLTVVLAAA
jgi:membrane protease YdiL (CAAX protease family)